MSDFVFVPLGGVGEIGMNIAMYGFGPARKRKWLIVDVGVTFPGPELPGVDLVLPDISFAEKVRDDIVGIVLTHAHEDHYGALLSLWDRLRVQVYATPFASGMIDSKRDGFDGGPEFDVKTFQAGDRFEVGPFEVEAVHVTHSIPEPVSLVIRTPLGNAIHTGDWKLDDQPSLGKPTDEEHFRRLGEEGVLALICDSTNAMRDGVSPSEEAVGDGIAEVIAQAKGRVFVATFSSNVGRIRSIAIAAQKAKRRVLIMGRSLMRVADVAADNGYMDDINPFLSPNDFQTTARDKIVVILTGSQGEDRAALARLARDDHPFAKISPGDTVVFSSRTIPGNERPILEVKNGLIDQGVEVIEDKDALIHVSGHPRINELQRMYEWTKPQIGVPVHGEPQHLAAQAALMAEAGIPSVLSIRDGQMIRLAGGAPEVIKTVPWGRIYKDGRLIGDEKQVGVKQRRVLASVGHVVVSIVMDSQGNMACDADLQAFGLPSATPKGEDMEDELFDAAMNAFEGLPNKRRRDVELVERSLTKAVGNSARAIWGKKPYVTVMVAKVK